jgi:hypothetical protein
MLGAYDAIVLGIIGSVFLGLCALCVIALVKSMKTDKKDRMTWLFISIVSFYFGSHCFWAVMRAIENV